MSCWGNARASFLANVEVHPSPPPITSDDVNDESTLQKPENATQTTARRGLGATPCSAVEFATLDDYLEAIKVDPLKYHRLKWHVEEHTADQCEEVIRQAELQSGQHRSKLTLQNIGKHPLLHLDGSGVCSHQLGNEDLPPIRILQALDLESLRG